MSNTVAEMVYEFHQAFGLDMNRDDYPPKLCILRAELIKEETREYLAALADTEYGGPREKVAKELADLLYVTHGAALTFGLNLPAADSPLEQLSVVSLKAYVAVLKLSEYEVPTTARELVAPKRAIHATDALSKLARNVRETAQRLNIDIHKAVELVHMSNMTKLGVDGLPIYRTDGKVLKGPNYCEPDMSSCLL